MVPALEGIKITAHVLAKRIRFVRRANPAAPASSRSHPAMPFGGDGMLAPPVAVSTSASDADVAAAMAAAAAADSSLMHDEKSNSKWSKTYSHSPQKAITPSA